MSRRFKDQYTPQAIAEYLGQLGVETANISEVSRPELLRMLKQCEEKTWRLWAGIGGFAKVDAWLSLPPAARPIILRNLGFLEAILPQFKRLRDELLARGPYRGKLKSNTSLIDERIAEVKAWIALKTSVMPEMSDFQRAMIAHGKLVRGVPTEEEIWRDIQRP
jgi:hypothetical protein